jgi:hypothetical protein
MIRGAAGFLCGRPAERSFSVAIGRTAKSGREVVAQSIRREETIPVRVVRPPGSF